MTHFFSEILVLFVCVLRKQSSVKTIVIIVFLYNVDPLEKVTETNLLCHSSGFVEHAAITRKSILVNKILSIQEIGFKRNFHFKYP